MVSATAHLPQSTRDHRVTVSGISWDMDEQPSAGPFEHVDGLNGWVARRLRGEHFTVLQELRPSLREPGA